MADLELGSSLNNDNFGFASLPDYSAINYNTDLGAPDQNNEASLSVDNIFGYAKDLIGIGKSVGIIPGPNGSSTQAVVNSQGYIQPTGANPVVQTPQSTTAVSWVTANPLKAIGIAGAGILGLYLLIKAVK